MPKTSTSVVSSQSEESVTVVLLSTELLWESSGNYEVAFALSKEIVSVNDNIQHC